MVLAPSTLTSTTTPATLLPPSTPAPTTPPTTNPVVSGSLATSNIQDIQSKVNDISTSVNTLAAQRDQAAKDAAANAPTTTDTTPPKDDMSEITQALSDLKDSINGSSTSDTPSQTGVVQTLSGTWVDSATGKEVVRGGSESSNAMGQTGSWMTNPTTGLNEFVQTGQPPSWQPSAAQSETNRATELGTAQKNLDEATQSFQNAMSQIQSGTYPLSQQEQSQLASASAEWDNLIKAQQLHNKNFEAGITQVGIARGLSQYTPDFAMGEVQTAVNTGLQKVADLTSKKTQALAKITEGFRTNDAKMIKDSYDSFTKATQDKEKEINNIYDAVAKANKETNDFNQKNAKMAADALAKNNALDVKVKLAGIADLVKKHQLNATDAKNAVTEAQNQQKIKDKEAVDAEKARLARIKEGRLSNNAAGGGKYTSGGFTSDKATLGQIGQALKSKSSYTLSNGKTVTITGDDGKTNTEVYADTYNKWVGQYKGLPQDFIKEFPPKHYLNQDDPTALPFFKMSGTGSGVSNTQTVPVPGT